MTPEYGWHRFYEDAILETDQSRLPELIRLAHAAIDARIEHLKNDGHGAAEEQQAIQDAVAALRVLKRESGLNSAQFSNPFQTGCSFRTHSGGRACQGLNA